MTASSGGWLALAACLVALLRWVQVRQPLRHDAIVLTGILLYFFIGTLNIQLFSTDWSPRLAVTQRVWMVVAVGVWGYLLGAGLGRVHATRYRAIREPPMARLVTDSRRLEIVGWLGLVALLVVYRAPALTGANREVESGYLTTIALLLIPAYLLRLAAEPGTVSRWVWARILLAAFGLLTSGYRTYTLVLLLSLGVVWILQPRSALQRARAALWGAVLLLSVGVGFGYWRFQREDNESGRELIGSVFGSDGTSLLQVAAGYTYVGLFREGPAILGFLVERHPALEPYAQGRAVWGMITSPLPGAQWDARAIVSKEVYGARQTSLVATIFGPWYLDFGIPGVFVGLAMMGYVLSRMEVRTLREKSRLHQAAYAYGLVLVGLSIHTGLSDFVFAILIPLVFLWAARSATVASPAPHAQADESRQHHAQDERGIA